MDTLFVPAMAGRMNTINDMRFSGENFQALRDCGNVEGIKSALDEEEIDAAFRILELTSKPKLKSIDLTTFDQGYLPDA